jgi:hypothetical protein
MNIRNNTFEHPEGKIRLLDGRTLDCYQSEEKKIDWHIRAQEVSVNQRWEYISSFGERVPLQT